jgi:hypothetical protein
MTESDHPSSEEAAESALRKALEEAEIAYREARPLEKPAALAEFKKALAAFSYFTNRR